MTIDLSNNISAKDMGTIIVKASDSNKIINSLWLECYFTPDNTNTSKTICTNCEKEKIFHTIGEGIKASTIIITN